MEPKSVYEERLAARRQVALELEGRAARVGTVRLVVAVAVLGLLGGVVWAGLPAIAGWGAAGLLLVFVGLVLHHGRIYTRMAHVQACAAFHERGLARLGDGWSTFPSDGARFRSASHPYEGDLDIFGPASLFQLLDTSQTRFGEERLASLLAGEGGPPSPAALAERQAAAKDLSERVDFREELYATGAVLKAERPDPSAFLAWAEGAVPFSASAGVRVAAWVLPALTILFFVAAPPLGLPRVVALLPLFAQLLLLRALGPVVGPVTAAVSAEERGFVRFAAMLRRVEAEPFQAPALVALKERLKGEGGTTATGEMGALSRIVGFLDARNNEVFRFFVGPLLLWDVHCLVALDAWRKRVGPRARGYFEVLGEVEALASLGGLAFDRPSYAWPSLTETPQFEAAALGHPLLPAARRVTNDVHFPGPGSVLVITGSNMSGKSTLLRAVGINAVLALAGAPVCAKSLRLGPVRIVTSMRVGDSLEHGVSHFYAELEKLKRVIDMARADARVLFLLDEILHGTNSRERLIGARAVVRELVRLGAVGGVSTHDLGLSDLEESLPEAVRNVHFEEQVEGEKMTFDYKLRAGVVTSSNALRLMRLVGIDVVPIDQVS